MLRARITVQMELTDRQIHNIYTYRKTKLFRTIHFVLQVEAILVAKIFQVCTYVDPMHPEEPCVTGLDLSSNPDISPEGWKGVAKLLGVSCTNTYCIPI